jgi:hypothetical protein
MHNLKPSTRTAKGQFKSGTSGNSSGRPPGSRNKATLVCEQLLDGQAEQLTQKAIELAMKGNINALRLCMERITPPRKERSINLDLRPVESPHDRPIHFDDIITAIAQGNITPTEGECLSNILTSQIQTEEQRDFDRRIAELENQVPEMAAYRREITTRVNDGRIGPKESSE